MKRHEEQGVAIWSSNGTPVDCVKLALHELLPNRRPDLVIGGINHGDNGSVNAHYSGTMGVVLEGTMKYIPSVASPFATMMKTPTLNRCGLISAKSPNEYCARDSPKAFA